jgi:hypothetical protein
MRNPRRVALTWVLAVLVLAGLGVPSARADHPLAGKWTVKVLSGGAEVSVWLLQLDDKDGKLSAKILSAGLKNFDEVKINKLAATDNAVHATMSLHGLLLHLSAYAPKGAKEPDALLGSLLVPGGGEPVRMERTKADKIDPEKVEKKVEGYEELDTFRKAELLKDRIGVLKLIVKKYAEHPVALQAGITLIDHVAPEAKVEELKQLSENVLKLAARYGPELETAILRDLSTVLLKADKAKDLAAEYALQAKKKIQPTVPASDQEMTLKVVSSVLRQAGKEGEADKLEKEIAALGPRLDEEFKATAIPFEPEAFKGRKGDSKRVVAVELFTGAQCPPCVAADVAFDALLKTYAPKDVVLLQYHVHIPGPDPLTNKDTEKRADVYYAINGTPAYFINGQAGPTVGGAKPQARKGYDTLREAIEKGLEAKAAANVTLTAKREGDVIKLKADVAKLPKDAKKLKLRLVVVEDTVHYPGGNRQRYHHNVVRGFVGGVDGIPVSAKQESYEESLDLKKLKLGLIDYLVEQHKKDPFLDDLRPLELQQLKVVAILQDDATKEILNAAQVDVP